MPTVLPDVATLRRAIDFAVRAPSVYNSQPWRWRIRPNGVELFADPDRHLLAIDPDGRDLLLSCGAALHHLVVGLAGLGIAAWPGSCRPERARHPTWRGWPRRSRDGAPIVDASASTPSTAPCSTCWSAGPPTAMRTYASRQATPASS